MGIKVLAYANFFVEYSPTFNLSKAAQIYAELRKNGEVIGHNDVLIAGIALENDLVLVTNNNKDFGRIQGLKIDNWSSPK